MAYASCPAKESALQQGALAVTLNDFFFRRWILVVCLLVDEGIKIGGD